MKSHPSARQRADDAKGGRQRTRTHTHTHTRTHARTHTRAQHQRTIRAHKPTPSHNKLKIYTMWKRKDGEGRARRKRNTRRRHDAVAAVAAAAAAAPYLGRDEVVDGLLSRIALGWAPVRHGECVGICSSTDAVPKDVKSHECSDVLLRTTRFRRGEQPLEPFPPLVAKRAPAPAWYRGRTSVQYHSQKRTHPGQSMTRPIESERRTRPRRWHEHRGFLIEQCR